jgi:small-conductance mechanosensitive channel
MVEDILNEMWLQITIFTPKFFMAAILILLSYYLAHLVRSVLSRAAKLRPLGTGAANLGIEAAYWGVMMLGIFLGLQQFFDVGGFLAGLGLLGFAVGFALQDVIKNLAAGILLIMQGPFAVGETIGVGVHEGTVEAISLRSIALRNFDGRLVHIPNSDLLTTPMINYTQSPKRRVQITVGVSYDSDLEQVKETAIQAISQIPGYQETPAALVVFNEFNPFAIEFTLYYWVDVNVTGVLGAKDYGVRVIQKAFVEAGIQMPYPVSGAASTARSA